MYIWKMLSFRGRIRIRDEFGGGTPQNFWSFMSPHKGCFIAFLRKNFRKFSKFGVLCPAIFFEKFPKISRKFPEIFSTFSKSKKTIIFVTKLVRNDYIDQNLVKFSHKTPKNDHFPLKPLIFQNFRRLRRRKFGVLCPKKADFFVVRVPPWAGVPPWFISELYCYSYVKDC